MINPQTETELAEAIASARDPLAIQGGGTRAAPVPGDALRTTALRGVTLYEPGALTMVAQAGTPLAEIEAALAAENQCLAFEPMDHRGLLGTDGTPTIGGVVAGNISGPRRIQAGACRDFLLGVRFVDGQGTIVKNGGRVMKNVTGYDLVKLMAGSWGTLGVLTEVAFKVLPRAETEETLLIHGPTPAQAVAAMSAALGSPYEVTGAAYGPAGQGNDPAVALRIEGFAQSVAYRAGRLGDLLRTFGEIEITGAAQSHSIWTEFRDVVPFHDQTGDVWRVSVKPSDAPAIAACLEPEAVLFDWGGGLIWARMAEGTDLRARMGEAKGHATLVRSGAATRERLGMIHPEPAPLAAISDGLRARFDPRGILNPGLMSRMAEA